MSTTPHLGLPLLAAAQAQKHVTHNEALYALDALVQCAVLDKDLSAPPIGPPEGAVYIVGPAPDGEWAGKSGRIVLFRDGSWLTMTPQAGYLVYVLDEALLYVFTGSGWRALTDALTAVQNLSRLGVGTAADATNPFSAKLNKALWTARAVGEGGTGDLRYTLNKESAANVLSLLFQTGYSGRCELGLAGSDDLVAKVSQDGTVWREAARIDATTGSLDFLSGESSLAASAIVDLGSVRGRRVIVTGAATIDSFGAAKHRERIVVFAGASTLRHNATSLILPGGVNIATATGDAAFATSDGSGNWRVLSYQRAAVAPGGASFTAAERTRLIGLTSGPNLVPNGTFESGLAGWGFSPPLPGGGAALVTASDAPNGNAYISVDKGTMGTSVSSPYAICDLFPVRGGSILDVSAIFRGDVAGGAGAGRISINWYRGDGSAASIVSTNNVVLSALPATWTYSSGQVTAPADAAYGRVLVFFMSTATARVMSLDLVSVGYAAGTTGIEDKAVTLPKLADAGAASLIGATAAGAHADLTPAQARAVLGLATTDSPTFGGAKFDANYNLLLSGGAPTIQFDTTDYLYYDRTSNFLQFRIANSPTIQFDAATITIANSGLVLAARTFATLPTASGATGQTYRVSDRNHRMATSDGTNWRYGDNVIAT